jgi:hypothetical protein
MAPAAGRRPGPDSGAPGQELPWVPQGSALKVPWSLTQGALVTHRPGAPLGALSGAPARSSLESLLYTFRWVQGLWETRDYRRGGRRGRLPAAVDQSGPKRYGASRVQSCAAGPREMVLRDNGSACCRVCLETTSRWRLVKVQWRARRHSLHRTTAAFAPTKAREFTQSAAANRFSCCVASSHEIKIGA